MTIYMKYIGDGRSYIPGVGKRDLTKEEWDRLSDEQRKLCVDTRLYEKAESPKKKDGD